MLQLHHDDYGAYELDHAAGEYALVHFSDPDHIPSAIILMSEDVAIAQALEILRKSAPHMLAGYQALAFSPETDGNVIEFKRRA